MREKRPVWFCVTVGLLLCSAGYAAYGLHGYDTERFWLSVVLLFVSAVLFLISFFLFSKRNIRFIATLNDELAAAEHETMYSLPVPTVILDDSGLILWYNLLFGRGILENDDVFGLRIGEVLDLDLPSLLETCSGSVHYCDKQYEISVTTCTRNDRNLHLLCFTDVTDYAALQDTFLNTRPTVMLLVIDNYEDVLQNAKESEKATVFVAIEQMLERFMAPTTGVLRKLSSDRFVAVVEEQHLQQMIRGKFRILDDARTITVGERYAITLSIGVGHGASTLEESEAFAKQALDMALGRGGDQVALKTENGYKFFGGVSKGVEKKSRAKTRIIANAMQELIHTCDRVMIMGHRYGDLDSIGSAIGLVGAILQSGKPAHVVVDRQTTLAEVLIDRMEAEDIHLTIDVPTALTQMTEQTLLIVVDTHSKDFVESVDLYQNARQVVVIDHHRKIVNFIDNAVIFYHEPYASSAAELVTELLQHFRNTEHLNPAYADVLLAGIMLDTKNFVMRTGVRTFEAAAYLRKMGADTIAVRQFFSSSIETYQHRAHLVSQAELYHHCAIAVADEVFNDIKLVAPQAADELLGIRSVAASFVLYSLNGEVNISARSMGSMNVQVVMEKLGGGGHQTMAATQIPDITVAEAKQQLLQVLTEEFAQPEQSK